MNNEALHKTLLSIHLAGVFIMLMGIGLLLITMIGLRRARTVEGLKQVLYGGRYVERLMPLGTIVVLAAGIWMAFLKDPDYTWHSAWIITAVVLVILFSINGAANIGKKVERIGKAAAQSKPGPLPSDLAVMVQDPALHYSSWMGIGIIFSFIVLMVEKPNWLWSVITVLCAAFAGLAVNYLLAKSAQPRVVVSGQMARSPAKRRR